MGKLAEVRTQSAPDSWSWVQQGGISSVKNQGQCGSCAAFATVAVIETCFWQQRGVMFDDLSEQHIVDCAINHYYNGGIYNDDRCCEQATDSQCKYNLNHEVTIVGYGSEGGMDFWLAKNSWATWFGENGFFKIKRGTGHCGVGSLHYTSAYCAAA